MSQADCADADCIQLAGFASTEAPGSSLLQALLEEQAPDEVYASPLVRSVVLAKWHAIALPKLQCQACWFALYMALFIAYQVSKRAAAAVCDWQCCCVRIGDSCGLPLSQRQHTIDLALAQVYPGCCWLQVLAVLTSNSGWSTAQLLSSGQGRAAVGLGAALVLLTVGRAWHQLAPVFRTGRCVVNATSLLWALPFRTPHGYSPAAAQANQRDAESAQLLACRMQVLCALRLGLSAAGHRLPHGGALRAAPEACG
jgi:hypothetical protein